MSEKKFGSFKIQENDIEFARLIYNLALEDVLKEREKWIDEFCNGRKNKAHSWMEFEKSKIEGLRK